MLDASGLRHARADAADNKAMPKNVFDRSRIFPSFFQTRFKFTLT